MTAEIEQYLRNQIIRIRGGAEYLPVQARVHWFRTLNPFGRIETEMLYFDPTQQIAAFKATIYDGENRLLAQATKMETAKGFADYLEKAETGAIGRALALAGYGTQFAPELMETNGEPITQPQQMVDSGRRAPQQPQQQVARAQAKMPVQRPAAQPQRAAQQQQQQQAKPVVASATEPASDEYDPFA